MAKDEKQPPETPKLPRIAVPAEQGEFSHQAEDAETPCVTGRGEPRCGCGTYALEWARAAEIQAP